ncbi:MAG: MFS transporter [Legionella sp.]|nr:MAG: MFS transporter [Legionella sp.]
MWMDLKPLKRHRDFRYAYFGQFISFFGTMMSWVALPYQIYHMTHSTLAVGLLGLVELVPLLLTAFIGGALADVLDRRKLLIRSEIGMAIGCLCLVFNALAPHPHLWLIYLIAALLSALSGLHRPSLDALMPRLVSHEDIQATSVLAMFRSTVGMIGGPAVAGICIASFGLAWTYVIDCLTFVFSIAALTQIKSIIPPENQEQPSLKSVVVAIHYAVSRQELMGTYLIDFVAMVFAMPNALFPAMAVMLGGTKTLGWLYAAPAIGAFIITVFSGWTQKIRRHGAFVAIAAILWGGAIACVGLSHHLYLIVFFLILAGGADCISGIFRTTIWNETIPDKLRGRMASLEMVSYMSGPLLGNAQVGFLASMTSIQFAISVGGMLCVAAVCCSIFLLPDFWKYQANKMSLSE